MNILDPRIIVGSKNAQEHSSNRTDIARNPMEYHGIHLCFIIQQNK